MAVMTTMIKRPETRPAQAGLSVRDLLADTELNRDDLRLLFDLSERVKTVPGEYAQALRGKQLAMIFEKPSLRTRTTFEVGMTSMGGFAVYLEHTKPRLGEREAIKDIARNLERWVHGVVARTFAHESVLELAAHASIPVINALTDLFHPCQALADFFTLHEKLGDLKGFKLAFVGDGNNVCHSLMIVGAKLGASVRVATPAGYEPKAEVVQAARACAAKTGAAIDVCNDPLHAVAGAQAVYTDVWTSMGQEYAAHLRNQVFAPYRVTRDLMAEADPGAMFMHCLPAHRGQEVADEVIDSPQSVVYDQAENRLHTQKALMILLMQESGARC
jgi:ornithine carbamoyltransferase